MARPLWTAISVPLCMVWALTMQGVSFSNGAAKMHSRLVPVQIITVCIIIHREPKTCLRIIQPKSSQWSIRLHIRQRELSAGRMKSTPGCRSLSTAKVHGGKISKPSTIPVLRAGRCLPKQIWTVLQGYLIPAYIAVTTLAITSATLVTQIKAITGPAQSVMIRLFRRMLMLSAMTGGISKTGPKLKVMPSVLSASNCYALKSFRQSSATSETATTSMLSLRAKESFLLNEEM